MSETEKKPDLGITDADRQASNAAFRSRSGSIASNDALVGFFYELMRDRMTSGAVEELVDNIVLLKHETIAYTNGYLALHAIDIVSRIAPKTPAYKLLDEAAQALDYLCTTHYGEDKGKWPTTVRHTISRIHTVIK